MYTSGFSNWKLTVTCIRLRFLKTQSKERTSNWKFFNMCDVLSSLSSMSKHFGLASSFVLWTRISRFTLTQTGTICSFKHQRKTIPGDCPSL